MISRIITLVAIITVLVSLSWAQDDSTENAVQMSERTNDGAVVIDTVQDEAPASGGKLVFSGRRVLDDCDKFKYPLLGVLFFGLFLGLFQAGMLFMESRKAKPLKDMSLRNSAASDIEKSLETSGSRSELGHLLSLLFTLYTEGNGGEEDFRNVHHLLRRHS
jgi:hypothetical protein